MGKKPLLAQVEIAAKVACGFDGFWALMMQRPTFSVRDIEMETNVRRDTVRDYMMKLLRGGYIERCGTAKGQGNNPTILYRIIRPSREAPRLRRDGTILPETAQETMWRVMKMVKRFAIAELAGLCATDERSIPLETVERYVRLLAEVGVLKPVITGGGRGRQAQYFLVRNLGGAAPRILRTHIVFDPNTNSIIGHTDVKEAS